MTYHHYTTAQIEFIKDVYQKEQVSLKELTKDFNTVYKTSLTTAQMKGTLQRYRIKTRRKCGCKKGQIHSGNFQKGHQTKPNSGQFKKGHTPWNKNKDQMNQGATTSIKVEHHVQEN